MKRHFRKLILAACIITMLISLPACRRMSTDAYYVDSKELRFQDGNEFGVATMRSSGGGYWFKIYFQKRFFASLAVDTYYYSGELAKLGIDVSKSVTILDDMKNQGPFYKVIEKVKLDEGGYAIYFHSAKYTYHEDYGLRTAEDKSIEYKIIIKDPDQYVRFQKDDLLSVKQLPLMALYDQLEKASPFVEKPDKE
jgi:hypothetical protein